MSGGYGGQAAGGGNSTLYCKGGITTTFTWGGTAPVPQSVIVEQTCLASWSSSYCQTPVAGTCSNGLGGPASGTGPTLLTNGPGIIEGYNSTGYSGLSAAGSAVPLYTVLPGAATLTLPTCNAMASITGSATAGPLIAALTYTAAAYPVTIDPVGATSDGNGGYDILVGQQCKPTLQGIPGGCITSNYQWGVNGSATTFQSWGVSADQSHTIYSGGPGPLNGPNASVSPPIPFPSWYWAEQGNGSNTAETITCTATVTPPAGQGPAFTVSATQTVSVYTPKWTGTGSTGEMQVSVPGIAPYSTVSKTDYWLWAGPGPNSPTTGINFFATISPPTSNPANFGAGSLELVQLVTPNDTETTTAGLTYNSPFNGQQGLDTLYPYPWGAGFGGAYGTSDGPGIDVNNAVTAQLNDQFQDFLMYLAPGSSQYVPVADFYWSAVGSCNLFGIAPGGFPNPAGYMTPISANATFLPSDSFPAWGQIVTGNITFSF